MTSVSHGKPCAGNPHARFEEGASAPESPRRNALLHTTGKALNGKPYAGNPHVRFDEGEVASCTAEASLRRVHCRRQPEGRASVCAAMPRRGSLLYKKKEFVRGMLVALSSRVA